MGHVDSDHARQWWLRFVAGEGAESPLYSDWALGFAADDELCERLGELLPAQRQPALVLASVRFSGVPELPFSEVRDRIVDEWDQIVAIIVSHATQTNDPRRSSLVLAGLQSVFGPIALIEVGCSAGFGLMLDRYSYRWSAPGRTIAVDPPAGRSDVVLDCTVSGWGANAPRIPQVVWREGIDVNPLDMGSDDDVAWLEALVWPEQSDRLGLVRAARDIVRADRPSLVAGDAVDEIRGAVDRARAAAPDATIVVSSPAVLVYLTPDRRREFRELVAELDVTWLSVDGVAVHPGLGERAAERGLAGEFVLTVDGEPVAAVDPLGRSMTVLVEPGLTPHQMDLLEFERAHWGAEPRKESLVRSVWNLALVRYYQKVYGIMDTEAARRYDPVLIKHFESVRAARGRSRIAEGS
jgi:Uncharacterized protein conserved in bacteria (DUF2332)/Protein of unknown function (DUF3263)